MGLIDQLITWGGPTGPTGPTVGILARGGRDFSYPLAMTNIAIENGDL